MEKDFIMQDTIYDNSVMIVDDDEMLRSLFETELKSYIGNVYVASNGVKCLEIMKNVQVELVILDLKMPCMNGLELLGNLCTSYPHVAKIVITGYGDKESMKKALQAGVYDFIEKPVRLDFFNHSIKRALEHIRYKKTQKDLLTHLLFHLSDIEPAKFYSLSSIEKDKVLKGILRVIKMKKLKEEWRHDG